jgi:integrase
MTLYECKRALVIARRRSDFLFRVVAAYLFTGMRRNEVRFLEWPDLDFPPPAAPNSGRITIRQGKGCKYRIIPFHPLLADILRPHRLPSGPVFPGSKGGFMGHKQWEKLLRPLKNRLPIFSAHFASGFHLLRYTFGSLYVTAGGDIYRLSQILGHASVATTQRTYAHLQDAPDPIFARWRPKKGRSVSDNTPNG